MANGIREWLELWAASHPEKVFIKSVDQDQVVSFRDVHETAKRIAVFLAQRDIKPNDRVVLLSGNSIEHLLVYYGVMYYGATICTVHVEIAGTVLETILRQLKPDLMLFEQGVPDSVKEFPCERMPLGRWAADLEEGSFFSELSRIESPASAPGPVNNPDDFAVIFYTSGTTELPKGVPFTFRDLEQNVEEISEAFGIGSSDVVLEYRSLNWMSAQTISALGALCRGAQLVLARKFSRSRFFNWIADHAVTIAVGNPTVISMLNSSPVELPNGKSRTLRFMTSSSAPLLLQDWRMFEEIYGIPIMQGYGSSETGWISACSEDACKLGTVGRPLPQQALRVVDEKGAPVASGEVGFVEVGNGQDVAFRYIGDDGEPVAHAFGRYRTGDLGFLDSEGYLTLTGRQKEIIIRGGVNISPVEIDNVLLQLDGISEAAVVGVPDPIYGEEVEAFVVLSPGSTLTAEAVLAHCSERLPRQKVPKCIHFLDELPRTDRGKLDRRGLADPSQTQVASSGGADKVQLTS